MRRMFGKTGVFCDGLMFAMVTDNTLYFALMTTTRQCSGRPRPFRLSATRSRAAPSTSPWRAPARLFDEPDELVSWARLALAAARRVAVQRERTAPTSANARRAPPVHTDRHSPSKQSRSK